MPKRSANIFEVHGNTIEIMRDGWDAIAFATYREDYYEEITNYTWTLKSGYPYNATLGGGMHRYMMSKWYGKDVLRDMTEKGYVVDHMNNNHMDCRISNLEFLKHNRNVAKGQYYDKESELIRHDLAVTMFKDFETGYYQITIGCNSNIARKDSKGQVHWINSIKLLYDCPYSLVVLDAEAILTQYDEEGQFNISQLHHKEFRGYEAPIIELTETEKQQAYVVRDGKVYLLLGNGKSFLHSVHYDKGWIPSEES